MIQKWSQLKHSKEFLGVYAESQEVTISFVMSVHPSAHYQPLHQFSWNFIFKIFIKICQENLSFLLMLVQYTFPLKNYPILHVPCLSCIAISIY